VPIKIFLATQIAEVRRVLESSAIKSLAEFRGKKIGMSPPGSATHAIAVALLEGKYGLKPADYSVVPGNEPVYWRSSSPGRSAGVALRGTTVAQISDDVNCASSQLRGRMEEAHQEQCRPRHRHGDRAHRVSRKNPDAMVKFVLGMKETDRLGREKPGSRGEILQKAANMKPDDARAYASLWSVTYVTSHGAGRRRNDEEDGRDLRDAVPSRAMSPIRFCHRTLRQSEASLWQVSVISDR